MQHHLTRCTSLILTSLALLTIAAQAQVPPMVSYQGRVLMNNTNFGGTGQFKFALVRGPGPTLFWKNDGSAGNTEPAAAVSLPVANGLVMTTLGDTALANMTAIPANVFEQPDVRLRVWFNGGAGSQLLTPDQRIVSVGYALMAGNVPDGAITSAKLANGAVTSGKIAGDAIGATQIAPGAVNSSDIADGSILGLDIANDALTGLQIADILDLGTPSAVGRLNVYRNATGTPSITLDGSAASISTFGSDGLEQIRLHGSSFGELLLRNSLPNNATAVNLTAQGSTGGRLSLNNTNGSSRAILEGENTGGLLTLYQADGSVGAVLYGNDAGAGALSLRNTNGSARVRLYGQSANAGGNLQLLNRNGTTGFDAYGDWNGGAAFSMRAADGTTSLYAESVNGGYLDVRNTAGAVRASLGGGGTQGGEIRNYEADGTLTTYIHNVSDAGVVSTRNAAGIETGYLWGTDNAASGGGQMGLKQSDGTETLSLYATESGTGGSQIIMRKGNGTTTVQFDAEVGTTGGGYLDLRKANGSVAIVMDADTGTVRSQVVEITGGSDFSEKFDIRGEALEPGMIVSIDPKNPGQLALCESAHDKKVAGIVSGAGGVKPGMLMGQRGSVADGKHPVALTGRVYCWVDADANGAIEPGDMLTTSSTPGHGMKVTDHTRAVGAIVGKAMTSLAKGKGLVLVLVNLQ